MSDIIGSEYDAMFQMEKVNLRQEAEDLAQQLVKQGWSKETIRDLMVEIEGDKIISWKGGYALYKLKSLLTEEKNR